MSEDAIRALFQRALADHADQVKRLVAAHEETFQLLEQGSDLITRLARALSIAQADNAALLETLQGQLDPTLTIRERHMDANLIINLPHPGEALRAELDAARAVVKAARERYWECPGGVIAALDVYDETMKARS